MNINTIPKNTILTAQYSLPDWKIKVGRTYKVKYNDGRAMIFVGGFIDREGIYLDDLLDFWVFGL